jgi:TonB family protein
MINEMGAVESAKVLESVHPVYDALLVRAAESWNYEPALVNGQKARFLKHLAIRVTK